MSRRLLPLRNGLTGRRPVEEVTQQQVEADGVAQVGRVATALEDDQLGLRKVREQVPAVVERGDLVLVAMHDEDGLGDPRPQLAHPWHGTLEDRGYEHVRRDV